MEHKLVTFFSASGITAKLANELSEAIGADLFEIEPAVRYSAADLDWQDQASRSTIEMKNAASRPAIARKRENMNEYDIIFVGFPIWWYVAPTIINTFLESYDFSGKKIILFATSGGSGFGNTVKELKDSAPGAEIVEGKLLNRSSEIADWAASL